MKLFVFAATLIPLFGWSTSPAPAAYPERTITIICASGAGGIVDVTARVLADQLSRILGRTVVVQNEPGAGSTIAIGSVAKAAKDGYTLLIIGSGVSVVSELYPKANIDVIRDLAPISVVGVTPMALVVHESVPGRDYASFLAYLKAHPNETTTGSNGRGSAGHLAMELFKKEAGVDVRYIPYKTTPQAHTDLIAGRLSMMATSSLGDYAKFPMLRPLAVTITERWKALPDVPTLHELGLKDYEATSWVSLMAPKGTPPDVIERLNDAVNTALAESSLRDRFDKIGIILPRVTGPSFAASYLQQEIAKWSDILRNSMD